MEDLWLAALETYNHLLDQSLWAGKPDWPAFDHMLNIVAGRHRMFWGLEQIELPSDKKKKSNKKDSVENRD